MSTISRVHATDYPPVLTLEQAAEMLQVPLADLQRWHRAGKLSTCTKKRGKHLRIARDGLIQWFFSQENQTTETTARKRTTIKRIAASYLKYLDAEGRAHKTMYKYRAVFRWVEELAKQQGLRYADELNLAFLDCYRQHRAAQGKANKTLFNETVTIKQLLNFAVTREMIDKSALAAAKFSKPKTKPQPFWSIEQVKAILSASTSTEYSRVYLLLAETGMRVCEAKYLSWEDIDLANRVLHIREKRFAPGKRGMWRPKTGEQRVVPLSAEVVAMLECQPRTCRWVFPRPKAMHGAKVTEPFNERNVLNQLKKVLTRLGLKGHVHTFRHSFISHALVRGVPEAVVREWVGHVDHKTILHYTHISDEVSHGHIDRLFAKGLRNEDDAANSSIDYQV